MPRIIDFEFPNVNSSQAHKFFSKIVQRTGRSLSARNGILAGESNRSKQRDFSLSQLSSFSIEFYPKNFSADDNPEWSSDIRTTLMVRDGETD